MRFKETTDRKKLERQNIQRITLSGQEDIVQLFELEDNTSISIARLHIDAGPPDQLARFPPRYQPLSTEQIVFIEQGEAYFFGKYNERPKEVVMKPLVYREPYGREAGEMVDTTVFPVKARLYCEGRRVMLALIGESDKEYHWHIDVQGALYRGTYQ
jgi:hypothetical protein